MPTTVRTAKVRSVTQAQPPPWQPVNPVEARLLAALEKDDRPAFFTVLMAAPLFLPQSVADPETATGANPEDYVTFVSGEVTYLLAFTSLEALQAGVGDVANGYVESDYETLRSGLAGTDLQLGFNLGTPIDAWLDVESVARAAAGEIEVPTGREMSELMEITDPANSDAVDEAAQRELEAFVDEYLTGVVTGDVLVASRNGAPRIAPVEGVPSVTAYSATEHVAPGTMTTSMPFLELVTKWPAGAEQLAVNPDTALAFALPAEVLAAFARYTPMLSPDDDTA